MMLSRARLKSERVGLAGKKKRLEKHVKTKPGVG